MIELVIVGILGTVLGSFANVCIWRLPRGESILWPPSHCPECHEKLKCWHLVPVLSWLFLRGKCAYCGNAISWQYPAVELATGILFMAIYYHCSFSIQAIVYCIITLALVVAVGTDLSHREIPDLISLGIAGILGIAALLSKDWGALLGGILLFVILLLIAVASRGGMGGGDIKLSLAIGFALGWQLGIVALAVAFIIGGCIAVFMIMRGGRGKVLPFAPFLAVGTWIAIFWGHDLIGIYMYFSFLIWGW